MDVMNCQHFGNAARRFGMIVILYLFDWGMNWEYGIFIDEESSIILYLVKAAVVK